MPKMTIKMTKMTGKNEKWQKHAWNDNQND